MEEIERRPFAFNDIVMISDCDVQKILREINVQELVKALKAASDEAKEKIFSNVSKRAGIMLQEEMEFIGPVKLIDAQEAQAKIISVILRLESSGDILIMPID